MIMVFGILMISCTGSRTVIGTNKVNPGLTLKSIINAHRAATPKFSTLASRIKVAYEDDKQRHNITVSLRMKKDEKIWMKTSVLGITLAKVLITQDRVSYYETISNTYFDGDFALISDWLGTDLNFEKMQAILLGQSIFRLDNATYIASVSENRYKLEPRQQPDNFIHSLLLNPNNFKVNSGIVFQPIDNRKLSIAYGDYQELEGSFYPSVILINSVEGDSRTKIAMNYRKINLNVSVSFPFEIPKGYEEIQLSK